VTKSLFTVAAKNEQRGQVEVTTKQSVTTETNSPANICQGLSSACDMSSVFLNTLHGSTMKVTDKHGSVFIDYCKDPKDCHTYRLNDKGTIRKVN
jgi:hypothetical protein